MPLFEDEEKRLTVSDNPYDATVEAQVSQSTGPARVAIRNASNPDGYAEAKRISSETNIPVDVVERNIPEAKKEAQTWKYDALLKKDPGLADQLANTDLSRLASDEVDKLAAMRDFLSPQGAFGKIGGAPYKRPDYLQFSTPAERTPGNYLGGLTTGFVESGTQVKEGVRRMFADVIGSPEMGADAQRRAAQSESRQFLATPEHRAWWEGDIYGGVASLTQSVPAIALTFANPPLGLAAMGLQQQAPAYNKYRDRGASPAVAALASGIEGVAEAAFEIAPMGFAVKNLGRVGMRTFIAGMLGREIPTEIATTIAQTATDTAFANPDKTWGQWASELPAEIRSTVVGTLIMSGAFAGAHKVAQNFAGEQQQIAKATSDAAALQQLMEASGAMNLPKRDIPTFTQFVNDAAAQGPVDSVYIDAATFAQAAQQAGVNVAETMPETAAALGEAVATKSDVRIPLGEFAANSTLFQPEIVQHLKTDPNGATLVETQDAAWVKETQAATEKALAQIEFTDAHKQSAETVKAELKAQLDVANRFTPGVNDAYAGFMSAFYATQAARLGITPEEMYVKYPLRIQAQNFEGVNVLTQPTSGSQINVGHNIGDSVNAVNPNELAKAIEALGVGVTQHEQFQSDTSSAEMTSIITTDRLLTSDEVHALSEQFGQQAIAHLNLATGEGDLHGPGRDAWIQNYGPFNPDYFYTAPGNTLASTFEQSALDRAQHSARVLADIHADIGLEALNAGVRLLPMEAQDYELRNALMDVRNKKQPKIAPPEGLADKHGLTDEGKKVLAELKLRDYIDAARYRLQKQDGVFFQGSRVKNMTPAINRLLKNLTPYERRKVTDGLAARIIAHLENLPAADEMAAVAFAGKAKRGWYEESARAISEVFGWDAPHFAALLAALSPQTSVEINLSNALRSWAAWDAAGRPRDRATIVSILGKSVEGSGTEKSVLDAWINNSVHALQDIDSLTARPLSGPKVNSFYLNLLGNVNEVTLDAWMANYALIDQSLFGGTGAAKARLSNLNPEIANSSRDPGKGTAYLAYASRVREAAQRLTKLTGETWTPAEVQETVWSWAKTLYETANAVGSESTAHQLVLDDALTDALMQSTSDFANLFHDPKYASILQDAGYGQQLDELAASRRDNARQPGEDDLAGTAGQTTPFDRATQKRHEARAAKRLDKLAAVSAGGKEARAAVFQQQSLKLPEYGRTVPGSISVVGVHFSKEARPVISSAFTGTGMKGAEQARALIPRRINFYVNQGTGIHPESDVGSVPHAVRLNGLYDASADRLNLFKGVDANTAEQAVVAHGFSGYYSRDFANGQGAAVLLGQHAVQAQVLTDTKAITEVPPPRDATPERELAEALVAVKGLPSGQMSGPEWISTMWKAAPQIAANIPEGALAALEAHTDLMYRDEVARTFYQQTPEVAKFLEGSAVQQVVYHSTKADFDKFKLRVGDVGIHFGTLGQAQDRLEYLRDRRNAGDSTGERLIPAYVNIKNPLRLPDAGAWNPDNLNRKLAKLFPAAAKRANALKNTKEIREFLQQHGYDGIVYKNEGEVANSGPWRERQQEAYDKMQEFFGGNKNSFSYEDQQTVAYQNWMRAEDAYRAMRQRNGEDSYIVFDHTQIMSALSGQMMQGAEAPRGQISLGANIQETPSVLTLLANADLSTFLHESGHFYLEVLNDMAAQPDAPPEVVADFAKTLAWFGVKDVATWNAMPLEAKRPFHEQFARGFEAYLFEGAAPSLELQTTFQRFRAWMVNVYQQLKSLDVALTDEVRGVFDRLVATNDEILQAETARSFQPLYETKPEGMTDAEWGDYHVLGGDATQTAVDMLQTRSLRDMQYASNAKSAALKRLQARAETLRKGVRAEVTAEVSAEPIYQVMRFLKTGVYEGENAGTYTTHRLDIATLDAMYPADMADRPPLLNLAQMRGHDGIAPDVVAQMFGYGSGDVLVRELLNTEPIQNKIAGLTDQRMLERYGDLADPASMEKAANAAVMNDVRAKFVATELRTLDKAAGNKPTLMAMAKEFAATLIARKKIRTIRPTIYTAAANKAAKNADTALRKDDVATAAGEKRNQLVNTYASRFASDAIDEVEKSVAYLKRVGESKSVDPEYRTQINALLERFDLRRVSGPEAARRQSLVQWMESQREKGFEPAIDPALENEALRQPYQNMTLEEFRGLVDSIKNIEHLGRLKSKLLKLADQRAFAVVVKDVADSIEHNAKKTLPHETEAQMSARKQILAMHTKLSSFMRQFDGWLDNGIMQRLFVHSSNAAGAVEAQMHEKATVELINLFEPLLENESIAQKAGREVTPFGLYRGYFGEKLFIPEINESLSREARIMVALNVGTEGNLQRLMDGDHWTDKQVQAVVDTLSKQEMDFVQSVWNFVSSYRPDVAAQQKRLTGVEPTWIPARQVVTKHGVYAGGYLPAKYNGALSSRSLSDEAAANLTDALRATRGSAAARASFTKERAAKVVNRPLRKDFGVITQHITEVTHRLAWQEWLVDVNRLLRASPVDQAIRAHYGPEVLASIRENIEAIAMGNVGAQNALERGVNYLRTGATIAGLGWRLTTSLLQPIGLTQSMVRIGPKWVGKGLVEFLGDAAHMENSFAKIAAKSEMMRLRAKTMQREISEIQDQVTGEGGAIKASFLYLIQKMQLIADIPTWLGQYEKALATSGIEDPAKLEANAIAQADQAVLDAQGAGQVKDLPAVLRGSPYLKLWTNFASFFIGTTFQLTRESVGRTNFKSPASVLMLAVDFVLLYSLPAALGTLMKAALSDDDDENKLVRSLIADQLSYMLGTMIGLRELGSLARAATGLPGDYSGPAGGRVLGEITKLGKQIQQGEADEAFFKALNNAAGVIFHYPAGQINSTADGIAALAEGKTTNPGVLAVGSSKK